MKLFTAFKEDYSVYKRANLVRYTVE